MRQSLARLAISTIPVVISFIIFTHHHHANAASIIRDTEIERTIRIYATPLLQAANLDQESVNFHIINDREVNAFVAGGQRMFLTTGLLRNTREPGQLLGVMAHELGHIEGGHLARLHGALAQASETALITQLLGIALGLLSGQPGAAAAVGSGGTHLATQNLLTFSRAQEQAADQAAVRYLDAVGLSSKGMLSFLEMLQGQELLVSVNQDPYIRTHPLTRDRVVFVENHVKKSKFSDRPVPPLIEKLHERLVAKISAFTESPLVTFRKYDAKDTSVNARYARAIAYYRNANLDEALPVVDGLIKDLPEDPYFRELKGQMLFESGRLDEALAEYQESVRLLPSAPLIRFALAHVQVESNKPEYLDAALANLKQGLRGDRYYALAWRLLATVYGRKDQHGLSSWALAEYNVLIGRKREARGQAQRALRLLKEGEPAWLRAQDIVSQTEPKN